MDTREMLTRHAGDVARERETGPLRPASRVRYEGSIPRYQGDTFHAFACHCWRCWDVGELRYRLIPRTRALDWDGDATIQCVRRSSLIRL